MPSYFIVRTHHGPRIGVFDTYFESFEINFTDGTLGDACIVVEFTCLLIVGNKMFQARSDSFVLDSVDHGCAHYTGKIGIFGEIFEIASAKRVAHNIDARCEYDVDTVGQSLITDCITFQPGYVLVPSGGQCCGRGETGAIRSIRFVW